MVPDYGYGVQTSYMLHMLYLLLNFLLLSYRYLTIIIDMIEKLESYFLIALRLN